MKKLCALLASAVLAAAVIPKVTPQQQTVSAADTVKIMPVGDSITYGMGENGGYRKYLYDTLKKDGYDIDMVGPEGSNSASANGITYDDNHAGYSGYQIKEEPSWAQQQGTSGSLYNKLKSNNAVKKYQPDIILLIIGTNDMTANRSMDACASDLRALVDFMLADMPSGGAVFMGSIPEFTAYGGNAQRVANYNNTVKSVAEEYAKSGKNVRFADVHGSMNGTADLGSDNLHPNGSGYSKMGKFWAETIEDYLKNSGSQPGTEPQQTTAPQNPWTPTTTAAPSGPSGGGDKNAVYKIMPAGDSITYGMGDDGGYRKYFDYFMKEKGYTKIDMVGPEGPDTASFSYNGKSVTYDNNHAGYSGYTIKYHQGGYGDGLMETLQKKNALKSGQPDVILLIIGTNDMNSNRSMEECESDLRELLDYLIKEMPSGCMIFLSTIPELAGGFFGGGNTSQKVASYNGIVKNVANEYKSAGKRVTFADIHGCLDGTNDLGDGVHPNAKGYEKMGKYFAGLVDEYLSASAPAETTTTTVKTTTTTATTTTVETTTVTTTTAALTTAKPANPTMLGDATCDGVIDVSDAVLMCRFMVSDKNAHISDIGKANADCDRSGDIAGNDVTLVLWYIARMIDEI